MRAPFSSLMSVVVSAVDLYYLRDELATKLAQAKVEQVYEHDATRLTIRFYKPGVGKIDLFIAPPKCIYLTTKRPAASDEQFAFCGIARKYLPGALLTQITQPSFSRTLRFDFAYKEQRFALIIELYDKGNIILLDDTDKILAPLLTQRWENRIVASGHQYVPDVTPFPQTRSEDEIIRLANEAAEQSLTTSKFATTKLGLGGTYGAFLCQLANISPAIIVSTQEAIVMHKLVEQLFSQKYNPCAIVSQLPADSTGADFASKERIEHIFPFSHPLLIEVAKLNAKTNEKTNANVAIKSFDSLSIAYEQLFLLHDIVVIDAKTKATSAAQKKLKNILDSQRESIARLEKDAQQNMQVGELLYSRHVEFDKLLSQVRESVKEHKENKEHKTSSISDEELKSRLKQIGVVSFDLATKTITLESDMLDGNTTHDSATQGSVSQNNATRNRTTHDNKTK